ncbi:MAG: sugar-binding domain-containing protein, partial [Rikenellaceae bacterium]
MLKRTLLSLVALLACAYASAASFNETEVRLTQNFNKDWRFSLSDNPDYRNPEFKDSKWRALDLPHDWSIESEYTPDFPAGKNNGFFSEGLGWYRKSFSLPADLSKKQFVIQFDGVYMNSEVWINGRYLGRRPYGYATFRYDLTAYLNFGEDKTNVIAVRVDNSNPGGDRWYHGSGIYRDVHLYITNYVHFKHDGGVYITTPMAEKELAVVNVEYELFGSFFDDKEINTYKRNGWSRAETKWKNEPKPHDCIIRSIVYDYEGNEVGRTEQNHIIKNYEMDYKASMQVPVAKPNRWSDKNPYLYYMKSQIEYKGKILDDVVTRFGIRKVELRPTKGLYVNEEMVKLKGVCLHHDAGALGAAVPDKSWVYRLNKLKEMGCNSIRTSHNPASPAFLALCDSLGFYVKDETVDEWTCGWAVNWTENPTGKSMNGYQHLFNQWAETDIREQIRRDRNHPSVIIYTLGNEIPDYRHYAKSEKTIAKLVSYCKEEDPTRPVCLGDNSYMTTSKFGVIDHLDLLGFNYIERDQGEAMYDNVYAQNPDKLTLGSETSSETMYFLEVRDNDYVIGQYIWTGIDYLGEVKKLGQRGWNTSLLDL